VLRELVPPWDSAANVVVRQAVVSPVKDGDPDSTAARRRSLEHFLIADSVPATLARELLRSAAGRIELALLSHSPFPVHVDSTLPIIAGNPSRTLADTYLDALERLHRRFANLRLVGLSRIVFADSGDHAAVYAELYCGPTCGRTTVSLLRWDGSRWQVLRSTLLTVS
jgi:hypothetical protein